MNATDSGAPSLHAPAYYELDEIAARTAHEMMSHREYRSDSADYQRMVDDAYAKAERAAREKPERESEAYALADKFARKYAEWLNRGYRIGAMCPSILVAGPAGVSPAKKERQNRAYDSHMRKRGEVMAIRDRIERLADAPDVIRSDDGDALRKLAAKAEALRTRQEEMKRENAQARKEGGGAPHPPWELSNNRQNLRATEGRIAAISAQKEAGPSERATTLSGEAVRVIENTDAMRLQLVFEGKPAEEVRRLLKKNGFRWSPKCNAWQRQLTANARFAVKAMESLGA